MQPAINSSTVESHQSMGNKDKNLEKFMYTCIKRRAEKKCQSICILITAEASNPTSPAAFLRQSQSDIVTLKPQ